MKIEEINKIKFTLEDEDLKAINKIVNILLELTDYGFIITSADGRKRYDDGDAYQSYEFLKALLSNPSIIF